MNKLKAQTRNQYHALNATEETPALVIEQTEQLIDLLEKQIQAHRESALELIQQHDDLAEPFALITGIKGIAQASGIQILSELMILPKEL